MTLPKKFQKLENSTFHASTQLRNIAGGMLTQTGRYQTNAQAADYWNGLAHRLGLTGDTCLYTLAADDETKTAAIYAQRPGTLGAPQIRTNQEGHPRFHLGALFAEHPSLRPSFRQVDVTVTVETDAEGEDCLVLYLGSAEEHRVQRRGSRTNNA